MPLPSPIDETVAALRGRLTAIYADRLQGLYVFGSHARGTADADSDLDVLVVLDRIDDYSAEIERTSAVVSELSLRCGSSISRVFVSQDQWRSEDTLFLRNVRREAIAA
jgi:predicted nucleotidyltransferase